jgi:rhamnosyltransferase
VPVHLTVPVDRLEQALRLVEAVPDVVVHGCENRGRDIAPFLSVLNSGVLDQFDAVLKLHTKRSPHLLDGEIRRKMLFSMLCGSRDATSRALAAFENPTTGLVGWAACYRADPPYWMSNETRVRAIAARMNASAEATRLGFFEGSMFWFRPAALAALRELKLQPEDFEPEERQLDGTLHHAVERCFTIAAWTRGFTVRDLRGRVLG